MAKIIEFYTTNLTSRISIHYDIIKTEVGAYGVIIGSIDKALKQITVCSGPASKKDMADKIFDFKLKYHSSNNFVFIAVGDSTLGLTTLPMTDDLKNFYRIDVDGNVIYGDLILETEEHTTNEELIKKIDEVYNVVRGHTDTSAIQKTIMSIKTSYQNTGLITKSDMKWLNEIYMKFKMEM